MKAFGGDQPVAETIRSPLYGKSKERLQEFKIKHQVKFEVDFIEGNITEIYHILNLQPRNIKN